MIALIAWVATLAALLTGLAMLHDSTLVPADRSRRGWARHLLRLAMLVGIVGASGLEVVFPARDASFWPTMLRCALVGYMAAQAPCPWWRYVFKGFDLSHPMIDRRNPLR